MYHQRAGSVIIETHGCLDTHCVSLKLESTLPVWSYPSHPALSLPPNHLLRSSLILSSLPLFLFFSTTVKRIQRVVENSCAGKHCLVVSVRISKNSRCFVETLFPAKNSSTALFYDFPPLSRAYLRSLFAPTSLPTILGDQFWTSHSSFQTYIPLSSALGNNFQTSLSRFTTTPCFTSFHLFRSSKKKRKEGRTRQSFLLSDF